MPNETNQSLENTLSGYNSTKTVTVGYREISEKHLHFCGGPVNGLYTSSSFTAQNILISRVNLRTLFTLTLWNLPTGNKQSYKHFGSMN